jgi:succinate-acetate transporter protein
MNQHRIGDPGPVALALFGFNLVVLGLREVVSADAPGALKYAILIAGIGQAITAALSVFRGETFLPAVIGTFGLWLIGFYASLGSEPHHVSEGVYTLVLLGPI